jgi:hypothetical protein
LEDEMCIETVSKKYPGKCDKPGYPSYDSALSQVQHTLGRKRSEGYFRIEQCKICGLWHVMV